VSSWRVGGMLVAGALLGLGAAQADEQDQRRVSLITDPRITEASGMALSTRVPGLAYVVNDSGSDPVVFSVQVSTGEVVGTTTLTGVAPEDPEALAIGPDGRLWVADIGDNTRSRDEVALLALPQPATGDTSVEPSVHRVRYAGGPADAEALVANPGTGRLAIATKGAFGGEVLALPASLPADRVAVAEPLDVATPGLVTDGATLPGGTAVVLRTYTDAYVYALPDWRLVGRRPLPQTRQGETVAAEPDGRHLLLGSEGTPSPIIRVTLPADTLAALVPAGTGEETGDTASDPTPPGWVHRHLEAVAGGAAVAAGLVAVVWWRRWRG